MEQSGVGRNGGTVEKTLFQGDNKMTRVVKIRMITAIRQPNGDGYRVAGRQMTR